MRPRWFAAARIAAVYPVAVVGLISFTAIAPQATGTLALVPIFAPHLLLATLLLVPLAAAIADPLLRAALALSLGTSVVLLGDEWVSWPRGEPEATRVDLLSWNLQLGARTPQDAVAVLRGQGADIIVLQELSDEAAAAIEADAMLRSLYPHRSLAPDPGVLGLGVLSTFPITADELLDAPGSLTVRLELDEGREIVVVDVHPLPGRVGALFFDGTRRDEELRHLRARVDRLLARGDPLVVIGDLNVASSEPSYRTFSAGLRDVHREVGNGPGWTWRPNRLAWLGVGVLRIDYVLASPTVVPLEASVDCSRPGDHCMVMASVDIR